MCVTFVNALILCLCGFIVADKQVPPPVPDRSSQSFRVAEGKHQYEAAQRDSHMPRYGQCWKNALLSLETGCKRLDDDTHHRLTLAFTNCFLEKLGTATYDCGENQSVQSCVKPMKDTDLNIYSNFFTHTQNMCAFLELQMWNEKTEDTISRLADGSERVAESLSESSQIQEDLLKKQLDSLKKQDMIIETGDSLRHAIQSNKKDVNELFEDYKKNTLEQRLMITEVFDRISSLQSVVLGEFTGFYSLIFYSLSIVVCYVLTSTPRTSGARFTMFVVMTLDVILERLVVAWSADDTSSMTDVSADIYSKLWLCRKLFWGLAVVILAYSAFTYKDLNKVNNQLLVEIKKQNSELRNFIMTTGVMDTVDYSNDNPPIQIGYGTVPAIQPDDISTLNESHSDSDDPTFLAPADVSCANESFESTCYWGPESTTELIEEIRDLKAAITPNLGNSPTSSPYKTITSFLQTPPGLETSLHDQSISTGGASEKKSKSKKKRFSNETPPPQSRYNLRRRSAVMPNPIIYNESPRSFSKMMRNLAREVIADRLAGPSYSVQKTPKPFFSDDDM